MEVTPCSYVTFHQKTTAKEFKFTGEGDTQFQIVTRALSLERWNEVEDIRENLLIPVGEKSRHRPGQEARNRQCQKTLTKSQIT